MDTHQLGEEGWATDFTPRWVGHTSYCAALLEVRIGEIYKTTDSGLIPGIFFF